ncbi:MAG: Asp-tRNA(Asn)/Glu-tRNA(Gln) amidotransferase subunit GatC [Bernardetiaceae bacterium]|nr:Asp-tRNA(Asn)/Glu-tRNA(Gln) amidotransferase subunit GatC [Bernardetiaceae bacterium]
MKVNVDSELLYKLSHLSRLEFSEKSESDMISDLNGILGWIEKLNEIDTEGIEPLTHISSEVNVLREDHKEPPLDHESGLKNAPKRDSDYFRVPKVIE